MMSDIKERLNYRALRMELGDFCTDLLIAAGMIDELEEHNKEMLEALEGLVDFITLIGSKGGDPMQEELITNARAAIAKAKGEE